jgi:hypothetical protein
MPPGQFKCISTCAVKIVICAGRAKKQTLRLRRVQPSPPVSIQESSQGIASSVFFSSSAKGRSSPSIGGPSGIGHRRSRSSAHATIEAHPARPIWSCFRPIFLNWAICVRAAEIVARMSQRFAFMELPPVSGEVHRVQKKANDGDIAAARDVAKSRFAAALKRQRA